MTPAFGGRYSIQLSYGRDAAPFSPILGLDLNGVASLSRLGAHIRSDPLPLQQRLGRLLQQQGPQRDREQTEYRGQPVVRPGQAARRPAQRQADYDRQCGHADDRAKPEQRDVGESLP